MSQLRSNSDFLNHTLSRNYSKDENCCFCKGPETREHYLFFCRRFSKARDTFAEELNTIGINISDLDEVSLLGNNDFKPEMNILMQISLQKFVIATGRPWENEY